MDLIDFYNQRVDLFKKKSSNYHRFANALSIFRLLLFVIIPVSFILLYNVSIWLSILVGLFFLIVFCVSVKRHFYYQQEEVVSEYISKINLNEIKSIKGDLKEFYGGSEFKPQNHMYASDLDIFGETSLYSMVNRSSTWAGRQKVAEWLLKQADVDTIIKRQNAIKELREQVDFRQNLKSFSVKTPDLVANPTPLLEWFQESCQVKKPLKLILVLTFFMILSVSGIVAAIIGKGYGLLVISIVCNMVVGFRLNKVVVQTHEKLSRAGTYLKMYSKIIDFIKVRSFDSKLLNEYHRCFFDGEYSANIGIKRLSKILDRFDLRLNVMIGVPLNIFFFWDIWQLLCLEQWKKNHGNGIAMWIDTLGEFEAILSFANLSFNNKDWAFPKIVQDETVYNAKNLGHPLIPTGKRVTNDIEFSGSGKMVLITGSNMSGKSTFLRTLGVNMILARAGAPVCSTKCEITLRTPFTSMRVADSLEENISTFSAELKRISDIIKAVETGEPVILLLDEVLRGTNSNDRHKGALAMLRQLVNAGAFGVMATHDLELADRELIASEQIYPFFFDVQVDGDELYFDYKLHKGECRTLNASILMRKMGIDLDRYGN